VCGTFRAPPNVIALLSLSQQFKPFVGSQECRIVISGVVPFQKKKNSGVENGLGNF
jgi:hypothetical protein